MIELQGVVTGRVQNVAYRAYVQESADALGLVGWVKNHPDGTVVVCAQGDPSILKEFVEYLHEGSLRAEVEAVSIDWGSVKHPCSEFSILYDQN